MLNRVYELETAIYRAAEQVDSLQEDIAKAKYDLRTARVASAEYSGLRVLIHKLTGKHQETAEELARQKRHAQAALDALQHRLEEETARLSRLKESRSILPATEELLTEENREQWARLESAYCAEVLQPWLDDTEEALLEYRKLLRGEYPVLSAYGQAQISAAPIAAAENCRDDLKRIESAFAILDVKEEIPEFFRNPAGFLAAAARHNQLEKALRAQEQTIRLRKILKRKEHLCICF